MSGRRLAWFSCGTTSAVMAKIAVETHGNGVEVCYCDTMANEHDDNARFLADCERWLGRSIIRLRHKKYTRMLVGDVFMGERYMSGVMGARCTRTLKKEVREAYQRPGDIHLFGFECGQEQRAEDFENRNPELDCEWPLIEARITKAQAHARIEAAGIALPAMYRMGYRNNNCKGCVKSSSPRY